MTLSNHILKTILYAVFFITAQCSRIYADDAATVVVDAAAKEAAQYGLKKIAENGSAAIPYIGVAAKVYAIVQEIKSHNFPNQEQRAHAEKVAEEYALLTAEEELEKCIIKNKHTADRMDTGLPSACKEIINMLIMYGGEKEATRITVNYNQYRQ